MCRLPYRPLVIGVGGQSCLASLPLRCHRQRLHNLHLHLLLPRVLGRYLPDLILSLGDLPGRFPDLTLRLGDLLVSFPDLPSSLGDLQARSPDPILSLGDGQLGHVPPRHGIHMQRRTSPPPPLLVQPTMGHARLRPALRLTCQMRAISLNTSLHLPPGAHGVLLCLRPP